MRRDGDQRPPASRRAARCRPPPRSPCCWPASGRRAVPSVIVATVLAAARSRALPALAGPRTGDRRLATADYRRRSHHDRPGRPGRSSRPSGRSRAWRPAWTPTAPDGPNASGPGDLRRRGRRPRTLTGVGLPARTARRRRAGGHPHPDPRQGVLLPAVALILIGAAVGAGAALIPSESGPVGPVGGRRSRPGAGDLVGAGALPALADHHVHDHQPPADHPQRHPQQDRQRPAAEPDQRGVLRTQPASTGCSAAAP